MRVGFGYDIHRLVEGRPLMLAGCVVPFELGEDGHSDGDVLIHALIDALLGAAALGDIGTHFPPGDPEYKDISSRILLVRTRDLLQNNGFSIQNCDCTVVIERPKLLPHIPLMKANLAVDLGLFEAAISIKAKTKESVDATGRGEAIESYAVALIK
jgi:2-C-methyl-D-erythritol 2,4-cyclodiphosphate synthase